MGRDPQRHRSDTRRQRRPTVLIVEDDPDSREILRQMVTWFGATAHAVAHGRAALKFLARQTPDLILLDLRMAGIDGYGVMKYVKANPRLRGVPTVAVTASCTTADYEQTWKAGFDVHLAKPIDIDALAGIVEGLVGRHRPHLRVS
jgi:CheY-like chemotaxis protein